MSNCSDFSNISNYLQNNNFKISTQPKQNFHFRYVAELKNSHGFVTGQQKNSNHQLQPFPSSDVYPSVKLLLPQDAHLDDFGNKRDFYILCSLHSYEEKCLSPHLLLAKGETKVNYKFIFEKMMESPNSAMERNWELKEYVIVRLKTDEFKKSLGTKSKEYENLQLPMKVEILQGKLNLSDDKSIKNSGNLNVCLGFTIFEKDFYSNTFRLYKETIFSHNIYHGDDIKIHQLCNTKGSIFGGTQITILIKLNSNFPLNVVISRVNEHTKATEWSKVIPIKNENIFGKHAITFLLPAYDGPLCRDDEIEVNIEVVVTDTTYKSQNVKFYYLNNNDDYRQRKRARNIERATTNTEIVSSSTNSMDPTLLLAINPNHMHIPDDTTQDLNDIMTILGTSDLTADLNNDLGHSYLQNNQFEYISRDHVAIMEAPGDSKLIQKNHCEYISRDRMALLENEFQRNECNILRKPSSPPPPPLTKENKISTIKNKIEYILKISKDKDHIDIKGLDNLNGNTIFHEAVETLALLTYLYKMFNNSARKDIVLNARNKNRENLLHYACKNEKSFCIRPLFGMGCRIDELDNFGRTPLHIAMEQNDNDCILEIQKLLKDHSKYPKEIEENFRNMFKFYNHDGYTVLHRAVIDNRLELVEIMLKFCQKHKFNVIDYEVLGNGNSIVHLVVAHNLIDMFKLIQKYIPFYLTIENYSGISVLDLPNISEDMLEALKC